ncbi:MAG: DUF2865 domain-containing protein [Beijerinckiaceae bacterium]
MRYQATSRVDPRALLRSVETDKSSRFSPGNRSGIARAGVIALCAVAGLGSFGTLVVRANDDAGALAFIRSQTRPRPVAVDSAPRAAYPVSYYAPRAFFPSFVPGQPQARRNAPAPSPQAQNRRNSPIVASYAPFAGFYPGMADSDAKVRSPARIATPSVSKPTLPLPFPSAGNGMRGSRVTYCVRTCDGFYFPLSSSTGSDKGDEAACNRLCPTSETRVYVGEIGSDIDSARARQTGRRYAQMRDAFAYRTSLSASCSCSASGFGLTNETSLSRDQTLRVGDAVMTNKGMRVFIGGQMPYREANFTTIDRSRFAGESREALRRLEQASLPGKSGIAQPRAAARRTDELRDLRKATDALQATGAQVRYVGPDRTAIAR